MRYFDNGNRLSMDSCAIAAREYENQSVIDYNTYNFFNNGDPSCDSAAGKAREMMMEYPNMRFRTGYGVADACVIDSDSEVRIRGTNLREKEPQQLNARLFQAVPNLGRGTLVPNLESMLIQGVDTGALRDCHHIAEVQYHRPMPLTDCMTNYIKTAADALPEVHAIGQPSKEIFMQHRKACRANQRA